MELHEFKVPVIVKINKVYYGNKLFTMDEWKKTINSSHVKELLNDNCMFLCNKEAGEEFRKNTSISLSSVIGRIKSLDTIPEGYIDVIASPGKESLIKMYLDLNYKAGILGIGNFEVIRAMNKYNSISSYKDVKLFGFEMVPPNPFM